jgi:hypothetical protein
MRGPFVLQCKMMGGRGFALQRIASLVTGLQLEKVAQSV